MVNEDTVLWAAGIGIALAVPATFMVANWVRKNVDHGEARFGPDGKLISDDPRQAGAQPPATPLEANDETGAKDARDQR